MAKVRREGKYYYYTESGFVKLKQNSSTAVHYKIL
jgi:hypothetical protein